MFFSSNFQHESKLACFQKCRNYSFRLETDSLTQFSKALPLEFIPYWDHSWYEFMYVLIIQQRALDRMAYINIIILSNLAALHSLFLSHYIFTSPSFCPASSPLSFQRFTIFSHQFLSFSQCPCSHHPPLSVSCRCVCVCVCEKWGREGGGR